jgi:hypothetical protein
MIDLIKMVLKYLAYGFIVSIYGVFAWYGKISVDSFVIVLSSVLGALGMAHALGAAPTSAPPFLVETPTQPAPKDLP